MLVITFKQTNSVLVPPIFIEIDKQIMVATTQQLINRVYNHSKHQLSPFITPSHLELHLKNGEVMYHKIPLFLYFNYSSYFQNIFCEIKCKQQIQHQHQNNDQLFLNLVLRISPRRIHTPKQELIILSKNDTKLQQKINKIILPGDNVFIGGMKLILTNEQMGWGNLINQKWDHLQNVRDRCLYICVDRIQ